MAEWFKRGTVNTLYRGSNLLKALILFKIKLKFNKQKKIYIKEDKIKIIKK